MSILVSPPGHQEKATGNYSGKVDVLVNIAIIAIAMLIGIGFLMTHPYAEPPHFASRIIVGSRAPTLEYRLGEERANASPCVSEGLSLLLGERALLSAACARDGGTRPRSTNRCPTSTLGREQAIPEGAWTVLQK